ncbi:hypothetical protein DC28_07480 [Spirochaeta lutea]|uniref:Uncharacterized protein n=1 Tax=Spirochaeta lutea TaxID=1480694 RepID=A0A098R0G9_9SPIO|nr:hypothetical protein DC28_07480 [Spirochaeta lutea]
MDHANRFRSIPMFDVFRLDVSGVSGAARGDSVIFKHPKWFCMNQYRPWVIDTIIFFSYYRT